MSSPKTRVEEEIVLLDEKIFKLKNFLDDSTSAYKFLTAWNQELLQDQLKIMQRYAQILKDRLTSWDD
jgi:hypothetical protein